ALRKASSKVVRERHGDAEHDDEGKDSGTRGQLEIDLRDCRQDASLHADHCAHKGVDEHQQPELTDVFPKAETDGCLHIGCDGATVHAGVSTRSRPRLAARICSISIGFGGTSASEATNSS